MVPSWHGTTCLPKAWPMIRTVVLWILIGGFAHYAYLRDWLYRPFEPHAVQHPNRARRVLEIEAGL